MKGFSFGLTSGIIATLGLIVGLYSSTNSQSVVIGGILIIAIADALSDSLGIHMSEESAKKPAKSIWESTAATFAAKFVFAMTFIVPVLLFDLHTAIIASIIWGLLLISVFSFYLGVKEGAKPYQVVFEHLAITVLVIVVTHYLGIWIALTF